MTKYDLSDLPPDTCLTDDPRSQRQMRQVSKQLAVGRFKNFLTYTNIYTEKKRKFILKSHAAIGESKLRRRCGDMQVMRMPRK